MNTAPPWSVVAGCSWLHARPSQTQLSLSASVSPGWPPKSSTPDLAPNAIPALPRYGGAGDWCLVQFEPSQVHVPGLLSGPTPKRTAWWLPGESDISAGQDGV